MAFMELQNIHFVYPSGHRALEDVSMAFEKGERAAIIGQNGAGKTTVAKLMNGLLKPSSGDVIIDGWNTKQYTTAKISRKVGYVFQNPDDQIFHNSVYQEIAFGPKNLRQSPDEIDRNVKAAADLFGIGSLLRENPYDLPLSVRKFVTAASVVAMNPDVIILDEPTAGQDKRGLDVLSEAIAELSRGSKTILTISHDMEFVAANFDRTIVMAHGNKLADGDTRTIFWREEILREAGIKAPYMSRLGAALGFPAGILDVHDLIRALKSR